jgi:hypothetical protein
MVDSEGIQLDIAFQHLRHRDATLGQCFNDEENAISSAFNFHNKSE